jgi:hypothetical protein
MRLPYSRYSHELPRRITLRRNSLVGACVPIRYGRVNRAGFVALGDRQRGKLLGEVLCESDEVMRSTEEVVSRVRGGLPYPEGGAAVDEKNYEVFILEALS